MQAMQHVQPRDHPSWQARKTEATNIGKFRISNNYNRQQTSTDYRTAEASGGLWSDSTAIDANSKALKDARSKINASWELTFSDVV